jgi:hypothetical protein
MTIRYHVASSDSSTSLADAIKEVVRDVQAHLDKGGKIQGGISISGWNEGHIIRYSVAQAVLVEE